MSLRTCLFFGSFFCVTLVHANEVKITSFNFTGTRTRAAEICGKVEGQVNGLMLIDITADPSHNTPGTYTAIASPKGTFCAVINTLTGRAEAVLRNASSKAVAEIK